MRFPPKWIVCLAAFLIGFGVTARARGDEKNTPTVRVEVFPQPRAASSCPNGQCGTPATVQYRTLVPAAVYVPAPTTYTTRTRTTVNYGQPARVFPFDGPVRRMLRGQAAFGGCGG
jgi:hypothetical protein